MKRCCIIWNDPEQPKAKVIDVMPSDNIPALTIDVLKNVWGWSPDDWANYKDNVHVVEVTGETQKDPDVIGTIALFLGSKNTEWIFTCVVPVHHGETAKQALLERGPDLNEKITFEVPMELMNRTHGWNASPLLEKNVGLDEMSMTIRIIGFIMFIDNALANALATFQLSDFWRIGSPEVDMGSSMGRNFSAHMQALCEDHTVDDPCALE